MNSELLPDRDRIFEQGDIALPETALPSRLGIATWRALQVSLWLLALLLLIWALRDSRFRDAEGFVSGAFCLPIAFTTALLIMGSAITTSLRRSAFWFGLAIIGQAVALQLIDAGQALRYQHYKPFDRLLSETHPLVLILLVLQTILVSAGLKSHWSRIGVWMRRSFRLWQLLAVGLVFFLSSATVSRDVRVYLAELPFATFVQLVNLVNIVLVVLALPRGAFTWLKLKLDGLLGRAYKEESTTVTTIDRFAVWAAIWVVVLAALLNVFSYERHPHIADEVVYLYHARYLASGMLTMPGPPVPEAFQVDLMNYENGRWFCPVPPGWPIVLAVGVFLGAGWLVNPLLAGLNVLLSYILIRELYDRRTARIGVLLLCTSPWYIFMAMNFMTHTLTLTCALVAALAVIRSRKTNRVIWAFVAGMAAGFVTLIRPLDGIIVGGVVGLWVLGVGGKRLKLTSIAGFAMGCVLMGALQFPYNKLLTGNPLIFPINAYNDKYHGHNSNAYGFGPDRGMGWEIDPYPGHGPIDALINANLNIFSINIELFGWSTGSLLLVALMVVSARMRRSDYLMVGVFTAVFIAYFFYYFSGGPDFGARYWFLVLVPFVVLTVRGIRLLQEKFELGETRFGYGSTGVLVGMLCLSALALVNYFPWRAIDKYHHYLGMRSDIRVLAKEHGFGKGLVLVRGNGLPDYASAAIYNPLDLRADAPVYAWDRNAAVRTEVLRAYPDRPVWVVNGPSLSHRGFEIVEGPTSAQALLAQHKE